MVNCATGTYCYKVVVCSTLEDVRSLRVLVLSVAGWYACVAMPTFRLSGKSKDINKYSYK